MEVRTIKGISKEKWIKFKTLAAKRNVPMGYLFESMIEQHEKQTDPLWEEILQGKRIISEEEALVLQNESKRIRKERGFRE